MAQQQGPPPTINSVQSEDKSLIVTWSLEAYTNPYDATLLVIDTTNNSMTSILLNTTEILEEEYTVKYLTNGNRYAILFSVLNSDGITDNSNTVTGIPSAIPSNPTIIDYQLSPPLYNTVTVEATLGVNTGLPATHLVFRICKEGVGVTPVVTTQAFAIDPSNTYRLVNDASNNPFEIGKDYIISCQALNAVGYSNVSNSIDFRNGDVAGTPTLGTIQSGSNQFALLPVSGNNTSSKAITSFKVYINTSSNTSSVRDIPITPTIAPGASYSLDLSLNAINNEIGYSLAVSAITNYVDESMKSNTKTVVPALKLAFSNAAITFPSANQIRVDFSNNNASWFNPSRVVTLDFSGVNVDASATITNYNVYTYTLQTGSLVAGSQYTVTINGYCIVPSGLYTPYWAAPALSGSELAGYRYNANALAVSRTYSAAPNPVTNISVTTNIINGLGEITPSWTSGGDNGSPIINYTCNLYTFDVSGNRIFLEAINTDATTCTFRNLQVAGKLYSVGIIATNSIGSSTQTNYPVNTATGFPITAAVPPVTDLQGYQTFYNGTDFSGNLTWEYDGPGTGYTDASFIIYSVVDGINIPIGTVNYVPERPNYSFAVSLGRTANVSRRFAVNVVAKSLNVTQSSTYTYVTVIPSGGPVISDVRLYQIDASTNWHLGFRVTNQTSAPMVQNGILSLVMPDPVDAIAGIDPIYSGYDASLVDSGEGRSFRFERDLGYTAINNDYVLITAVNTHGETVYKAEWGVHTVPP